MNLTTTVILHCQCLVQFDVNRFEVKMSHTWTHGLILHPQVINDNVDCVEAVPVTHDGHDPLGVVPGLLITLCPNQRPVYAAALVSHVKSTGNLRNLR